MTCATIQPLLEAFANHDLSPLTQWRIRNHLTHCPACTAELAESVALTARVRDWQNVPAPAGLEARIAAKLPAAAPAPARPPIRRAAVGLAGFAAALAAAFWLVPGQPGRPTVAFAEVEQAMQQVQTASWRTTQRSEPRPGHRGETFTFTNWLRRNPAAMATTDFVSEIGSKMSSSPQKYLINSRGTFELNEKDCIVTAPSTTINQQVTKQIKSFTQPPQANDASITLRGQVKTVLTSFHQENVIVSGENQTRFDREFKTTSLKAAYQKFQEVLHVTQWVNSDTHRIARVELRYTKDTTVPTTFTTLVEDHFQYNTPAPSGVFDWSPPPGMKIRHK